MAKKPNILLITTDQQRFDTIHAAGNPFIQTPNLDRLMQEGCYCCNAYSPNPVCIPARHNILTGLPARYHGFDDNYFIDPPPIPYQLPTFAQILTDNGYDASAIGKMHFQPARRHNGFTNIQIMEEIPIFLEDDDYALFLKEQGYGNYRSMHGVRHMLYMLPQRSLFPEELHGTAWVADRTIDYLRKNAGKRPFMAWASFIEPHPPFDVPGRWAELYRGKPLPEPSVTKTPLSAIADENHTIADYPDSAYLRRARELYYGAISFVDYNIGRILDALEESGELDNTLVVFTSDHGEMLGDHGTYQKFLPYDGAAKIPMIVRYPAKCAPGSIYEPFVDLNDLLPTFLDAAGLSYPGDISLPGESIFQTNGNKDRAHQYVEHCKGTRRWISMRDRRYKYNYYFGGGHEELFDMREDPQESVNLLYGNPGQAVLAARDDLKARLTAMESRWGLDGYVRNGALIRLDEYQINYYREMNFPLHIQHLTEKERENLISIEEEILNATEKEPIVHIEDLDLETFQRFSGFTDAEIRSLLLRDNARRKEP